jgi:methoxymalonate biosynthesis acyl carrier protein
MKENKAKIRTFLGKYIRTRDFSDDEDLFASGYVNSLFAMQLVLFVEGDFGIKVERDDLKLDNFKSVNAISALISNKQSIPG